MKLKLWLLGILSVVTVCLLLGASASAVVHSQAAESGRKASSPLFAHQISQSIQAATQLITPSYLAKNKIVHLAFDQPTFGETFKRAIQLIQSNPREINAIFTSIEHNAQVIAYLASNGMSASELHRYLSLIRTNPEVIISQLKDVQTSIPITKLNGPAPLQLNTTNPFACVLTVIVLLPVLLIIGFIVVLFTLRIIQCLNFNEVMNQLADQLLQGLRHPQG